MPNYRILASDLDGTLFNSHHLLSAENEQAIAEIVKRGVWFVPSSGRAVGEMPSFLVDHPSIRYIIYADGAAVYDKQLGRAIIDRSMPQTSVVRALEILEKYAVSMTVRRRGISYVDEAHFDDAVLESYRIHPAYRRFIFDFSRPTPNFSTFCRSLDSVEMICIFFRHPAEQEECRGRLAELGIFGLAASAPTNIEIFDCHAGKGSALLALAEHLGVDPSQTIAVGDSPNDVDMLKKAGLSLAMGNADDVVKALADKTVCTHDEHVARYILNHYI